MGYFRHGETPWYILVALGKWQWPTWETLLTPVDGYFMHNFANTQATQRFVLAIICVMANCSVLKYHLTEPPHPKFLVHWRRKYMIRTHLVCGVSEMFFTVVALITRVPLFALAVSIFCFLHVLTSAYLMTGLFGIRNIMVPCYSWAVLIHAIKGALLVGEITSVERLIQTFLTLQIYVWVRVAYTWLERIGIMRQYQYTFAVLIAGLIILPSVMAESLVANWLVVVFIGMWNAMPGCQRCCCQHVYPKIDEEGDFWMNNAEIDREHYTLLKKQKAETLEKRGTTESFLSAASASKIQHVLEKVFTTTSLLSAPIDVCRNNSSSGTFYSAMVLQSSAENIHEECPFAQKREALQRVNSLNLDTQTQAAKYVYDNLCSKPEEGMTEADWQELIAVWGLPYRESEYIFQEVRHKLKDPEVISFDEFFEHFSYVWKYALAVLQSTEDSWGKIFSTRSFFRTDTGTDLKYEGMVKHGTIESELGKKST